MNEEELRKVAEQKPGPVKAMMLFISVGWVVILLTAGAYALSVGVWPFLVFFATLFLVLSYIGKCMQAWQKLFAPKVEAVLPPRITINAPAGVSEKDLADAVYKKLASRGLL